MSGGPNRVELVGTYGSDLSHALSAWTSTSRDLDDDKRARVPKLLRYLAENKHHTPFEKSAQHFLVTSDIASHIHILKHRIAVSVNAESARYKELSDDKYYVPTDWPPDEVERYVVFLESALDQYHETLERLVAGGMKRKRAKESARFYLPYGNQIKCDVQFNFRSLMHFAGLRFKPDAQLEIREICREMLRLVWLTGDFNKSLAAFGYDGIHLI